MGTGRDLSGFIRILHDQPRHEIKAKPDVGIEEKAVTKTAAEESKLKPAARIDMEVKATARDFDEFKHQFEKLRLCRFGGDKIAALPQVVMAKHSLPVYSLEGEMVLLPHRDIIDFVAGPDDTLVTVSEQQIKIWGLNAERKIVEQKSFPCFARYTEDYIQESLSLRKVILHPDKRHLVGFYVDSSEGFDTYFGWIKDLDSGIDQIFGLPFPIVTDVLFWQDDLLAYRWQDDAVSRFDFFKVGYSQQPWSVWSHRSNEAGYREYYSAPKAQWRAEIVYLQKGAQLIYRNDDSDKAYCVYDLQKFDVFHHRVMLSNGDFLISKQIPGADSQRLFLLIPDQKAEPIDLGIDGVKNFTVSPGGLATIFTTTKVIEMVLPRTEAFEHALALKKNKRNLDLLGNFLFPPLAQMTLDYLPEQKEVGYEAPKNLSNSLRQQMRRFYSDLDNQMETVRNQIKEMERIAESKQADSAKVMNLKSALRACEVCQDSFFAITSAVKAVNGSSEACRDWLLKKATAIKAESKQSSFTLFSPLENEMKELLVLLDAIVTDLKKQRGCLRVIVEGVKDAIGGVALAAAKLR